MHVSDCVIIYLNKNKFCVALSTICDTFLHINKQTCYFNILGEISFLGYKVGKLIFFLRVVFEFCTQWLQVLNYNCPTNSDLLFIIHC